MVCKARAHTVEKAFPRRCARPGPVPNPGTISFTGNHTISFVMRSHNAVPDSVDRNQATLSSFASLIIF
jgi:hypothetical protein